MLSQASADRGMGEFTFKKRPFPRLHCFKAQFPRSAHAALAHAAGAIAVPVRRKHQRGVGSGPLVLGQSAHGEFRSAYSKDQRRLGKQVPAQMFISDVPAYGYANPSFGSFDVTYSGGVRQVPGLYQINFQIPLSIGEGPDGYGAWPCGDYSWELATQIFEAEGYNSSPASN